MIELSESESESEVTFAIESSLSSSFLFQNSYLTKENEIINIIDNELFVENCSDIENKHEFLQKKTILEEKNTFIKTHENDDFPEISLFNGNEKKNDNFYSLNIIKTIFEKNGKDEYKDIIDEYAESQELKEAENNLIFKKEKRNNKEQIESNVKYGRGRKERKGEPTQRKHNKFSEDNIIKKIKSKLIKYLIKFANNILKSNLGQKGGEILKMIDYKTNLKKITKAEEINILNMDIKDLLSKDISSKFNKFKPNQNKEVIEYILDKKEDDQQLAFVFEMKFREWINFFLLKEKVENYRPTEYKEEFKLEENMPKITDLLEEIHKKNKDKKYLSHFILYLYNYERWFSNKKERNKKTKYIEQ